MSGWPRWVTQMAVSPPCHDRVPLLQVSRCVTPHVANQSLTSNETDIDIKDVTGFHEKCKCILFVTIVFKFLIHHLHVRLLLNYSSFLDIALYQKFIYSHWNTFISFIFNFIVLIIFSNFDIIISLIINVFFSLPNWLRRDINPHIFFTLLSCTKSKKFKAVTIVCPVHIHREFVSCYSH